MDIAQHKSDALALDGALRALRTLSATNEELVAATSEPEFLRAVCRVVVEKGGYLMSWVGFSEQGQDKAVRPVAQYGHDVGYLDSVNITWADTERGQGPTGCAIRTGQAQINQNVLTNPVMDPWRKAALERGFQSSIALPLKGESGTIGALAIYARDPGAFRREEVALLKELAADLAFGIVTLRTKAERDRIAEQNRQYETRLHRGLEETIQAVSAALKLHDGYTYAHQKRVAALAETIANEMDLPENVVHGVKVAALVHDIGKLKVPCEILAKPGELSKIEFCLFQEHAQTGRDLLKDITFPWPIADIVWQHHERLDGSGYPRRLRGDEILLEARVIAVADVVDEAASPRPYRPALGIDVALQEIGRGRGKAFDSAAVDACTRLCREDRFMFPAV